MILVITHTADRNRYDHRGRLIEERGTVTVSHGVDCETGRTHILENARWSDFKHHCVLYDGEWYLK
jgi:hypothetical protein